MKRPYNWLWIFVLVVCIPAAAANLPSDWRHEQSFDVSNAGLVKISLPVETLDAARPALEDLRLYDGAGTEVPYLIERPAPAAKVVQAAKSFQVSLNADTTIITLETGLAQPLDGVTLESPARNFIKAVRVESSDDGQHWQILAEGQPIFRQPYGASQLHVSFPGGNAKWLRLTVDDRRSQPIPFTGALVHAATGEAAPGDLIPVIISERDQNPGETRLALNLGAANLSVVSVRIETAEPLFMRQVSIAVPQISEDSIREQTIGQGAVYRVAVGGQAPSENLSLALDSLVRSRELILLVKNGDSPPLAISGVRVERRPVYLVFLAPRPGAYHLLTGNDQCTAPVYDLAALGMNLQGVAVSSMKIPPPADNPDFHAPEVLPGLELTGATLDISAWKYRKPVNNYSTGALQIELSLDVLGHAQPGFADLRLLHGSNQVPYVIQRTSIIRSLTAGFTATNDSRDPQLSRWIIKLPQSGLPITRLTCVSSSALFERSLSLYEELPDDRGDVYRRALGGAIWTQTPDHQSKEFALALDSAPQSDTLFLETDNGDNPPIGLQKFAVFYPATRILFKARADDKLFLYYGNPHAAPPSYDLSLVAGQLLAARKATASLSTEEELKKSSSRGNEVLGKAGFLFWGILALVVVGLLVIISRLLPKPQPPPA
ncbi:MAG: DUF3999 family protein [Verrucomicrobiota bacterium]